MDLLSNPFGQTVVLPLLLSAGVLWAAGRLHAPRPVLGVLFAAAVLACLVAALGVPPLPPRAGLQKLAWLLAVVGVAAFALERVAAVTSRRRERLTAGFLVLSIAWLAWPQLVRGGAAAWLLAAVGAVVTVLVVVGVSRDRPGSLPKAVMLLAASAGLAASAAVSGSLAIAQTAGALSVAAAVVCLWLIGAPPRRAGFFLAQVSVDPRDGPAADALLQPGLVTLALLATVTLLVTDVPAWSIAALPLVFLADRFRRAVGAAPGLLVTGALAALPAVMMPALSLLLTTTGAAASDPYY